MTKDVVLALTGSYAHTTLLLGLVLLFRSNEAILKVRTSLESYYFLNKKD